MNHQAWASRQLVLPVAMVLVFAPALRAAESSSRFHRDGKTEMERVPSPPTSLDHIAGAQEVAGQTSPRPSPITAEQPTAKALQVSYEDGQLTISAENASLSEVMKALREALGADIDLPASVVDQRIWVHLGPGPARSVLRDLLDGTEFNYVIQASENDPDGIRSVLLTARSKSAGAETAGSPERSAIRRMPGHGSDTQGSSDSENPPSEPVASADPPQAPAPAPPVNAVNAPSASPQNAPNNADTSAPKAASRTDQLIQQMQSMYEQRRQLQMQQNQKATGQN